MLAEITPELSRPVVLKRDRQTVEVNVQGGSLGYVMRGVDPLNGEEYFSATAYTAPNRGVMDDFSKLSNAVSFVTREGVAL